MNDVEFPDFELALRRMGWLSSYSRQVLLSRHMLRCLQEHDVFDDILSRAPKRYMLDCLRAAITALSGVANEKKIFSAPYFPEGRPDTHFLAFNRKERLFEVSAASGGVSFSFHYSNGGGFGFDNGHGPDDEDILLIDEISRLAAGVTLSTKKKADDRIAMLRNEPLWGAIRSDHRQATDLFFQEWFPNQQEIVSFWKRWMEGLCNGEPMDWELQRDVALIPEAIWKKGTTAVANEIAAIEAELLLKKLPQIEDVYQVDNGLYDVRAVQVEPSALIDSIAGRVQFAFDLAVQSNACDLDELSTAAKLLRHAIAMCLDDPNALEQFLRQASLLITDGLARGDFSHHETLDVLITTLNEVGLQLRADHPEVAAAVASRAEQAVKELSDAKRLEAAALIEDLREEGTTGRLKTEMGLAAETTRDGTSDAATSSALKRTGNQAGKISLAEKAKKVEGSGVMASVKIALRADKLVDLVMSMISGGGV